MGLSDAAGKAQITREKLEADFLENQQLFPMDYREPLDQCDPVIEIRVRGGDEFVAAKENLDANSMVEAHVREAYARAANQRVESFRTTVSLLDTTNEQLSIDVHLNPAV
jgi:hypothetical protein